MARALIAALLLALLAGSDTHMALAQTPALQTRLQQRFDVLPVANGVVLKPKFKTAVRSVEVTDAIAIDGSVVTGAELRQKLGVDADLGLQVSYLPVSERRSLGGIAGAPTPAPAPEIAPAPSSPTDVSRTRKRDALVRVGGSVTVAQNEIVTDDVAVIGGSADIDGQVQGDVAVIGGSLTLGPHAEIDKDVTVVGGRLSKDPNAIIRGKVAEIGVGGVPFGRGVFGRGARYGWRPNSGVGPVVRFGGTIVRIALLMLLSGLVLLVARPHVEQIAERAAAEPVKSWLVGFLAEILFAPMLVLTVVVLAISIIGIPLLILVPLAIVAAMVVSLLGFTAVAYHIGGLLQGHFEPLRARPYAATLLAIAVIVSPLLLARFVGLTGQLGIFAGILVAIGTLAEYIAWTTGLGAVALARFSRPHPLPSGPTSATPDPQIQA
jgi:hypothetical protein